jgi:hypothetical protein
MPRGKRIIRVTSEKRDPIDPHMMAQILIDLLGPAQVEALTAEAERSGRPDRDPRVWREEDGEHPRS